MKEKEKGKYNPFAAVLRPDEEILWFQAQSSEQDRPFGVATAILGIIVGAVSFVIALPAKLQGGLVCASASLACIVGFFTPYMLIRLSQRASHTAYALTDLRWLTYKDHLISAIPLEDLPVLEIGKGAIFLMDLPEPQKPDSQGETLRQLMSQARENRLKMLSEVQTQ